MKKTRGVLESVAKLLDRVKLGKGAGDEGTATVQVTADELLEHVVTQLGKLDTDTPRAARKRLRLLAKAVELGEKSDWAKDTITVPTMDEPATTEAKTDVGSDAELSKAAAELFEGDGLAGWTAKIAERLGALKGDSDEEEEEDKAKGGKREPQGKVEWTTKYVNDLPDSSFLYVEPGADKDAGGRTTPRSKRHFPVRDAMGKVDTAHAENAIGRIPQSKAPGLDDKKKKALQDEARKLMAGAKKTSTAKAWRGDLAAADGGDGGDWGNDD